jgi:hypothetical protein
MSLPLAPRPRPPTHKPYDAGRLMAVASELPDALGAANAERLTPEVAEDLAPDLDATEAQIYAAATLFTDIPCDFSNPIRFELCIGNCQGWGAGKLLEHLLQKHADRRSEGSPNFGIVTKRCLDKCDNAAMVLLHTPDGTAALPMATVASIDEAIAQLFA